MLFRFISPHKYLHAKLHSLTSAKEFRVKISHDRDAIFLTCCTALATKVLESGGAANGTEWWATTGTKWCAATGTEWWAATGTEWWAATGTEWC